MTSAAKQDAQHRGHGSAFSGRHVRAEGGNPAVPHRRDRVRRAGSQPADGSRQDDADRMPSSTVSDRDDYVSEWDPRLT